MLLIASFPRPCKYAIIKLVHISQGIIHRLQYGVGKRTCVFIYIIYIIETVCCERTRLL